MHHVYDVEWLRRAYRSLERNAAAGIDGMTWQSYGQDLEVRLTDLSERLKRGAYRAKPVRRAVHPDKTRLLEFGRFAASKRKLSGKGRPETFQFLGFTHIVGRTSTGRFAVTRKTARPRMISKLKAIKEELRHRHNAKLPELGRYLHSVVLGHFRYYGVPGNLKALSCFRVSVSRIWKALPERRSQRTRITWERMTRLIDKWLPKPIAYHPYPLTRFSVTTQGRSRMR